MTPIKTEAKALAVILLVGVFYLATIREGHDWGDDFSMYIHHAKNIASGKEYGDTGYIYNPKNFIGPQNYPPVFPAVLAPAYALYGLNLGAFKSVVIVFFTASLVLVYLAFKDGLKADYLLAFIAVLGFNPFLWSFKDSITADIPFMFFTYVSLVLVQKYGLEEKPRTPQAFLAGVFIYLAYGTRSIGFIILPSVIAYGLLKKRRLGGFTAAASAAALTLMVGQEVLMGGGSSYSQVFSQSTIDTMLYTAVKSPQEFSVLWVNCWWNPVKILVFAAFSLLALAGFLSRATSLDKTTPFEVFAVFYAALVVAWPVYSVMRLLIPLVPLYMLYAFTSMEKVASKGRAYSTACAALVLLVSLSYLSCYTAEGFGLMTEGVSKKESVEMFEYVKENTGKDDVFVFLKPRALSLYTGRKASTVSLTAGDAELWEYFSDIKAAYVIVGPPSVSKRLEPDVLKSFAKKNARSLREVYSNKDFKVYKIIFSHPD